MPYAVNISKGTVIHNDDIGDLPTGVAIPITDRQVLIAKHIRGVAVFEKIAGRDEVSKPKSQSLYGIDKDTLTKIANSKGGK